MRRIGVLMGDFPEDAPEGRAVAAAFREELQKLGWTEGRNIRIDYRWAAADIEAMQRFAKELLTFRCEKRNQIKSCNGERSQAGP